MNSIVPCAQRPDGRVPTFSSCLRTSAALENLGSSIDLRLPVLFSTSVLAGVQHLTFEDGPTVQHET